MADGFHAGLFDELEALYPDSSGGAAQYGVAAAKGTVAGVHCNKGDSVNVGDLLVSLN